MRVVGRQVQLERQTQKSFVSRPKSGARREQARGKQVGINVPDTCAVQGPVFDDQHHLLIRGQCGLLKRLHRLDQHTAIGKAAQGQFTGDEGVSQDLSGSQKR